ncbi:Proline iminopeptidase [Penicillium riverlandense]|uniref:Proline iminopeptidase n=1 Tax=Penicillium riverlandense TaxID=1903569 RepID=UPI00254921B9|nr:Proline iminopeptidase [Penicillium riverlandense]KAJ5826085.1 Proline iminopeptidase [Penicillium riverlandense]
MAAKLIDRRFHNVPGKLRVAELFFDVPVDYSKPNEDKLRLFARSVSRLNKPVEAQKEETKLPWLLYLQGGPGHGCAAPQNYGWIEPVLNKGYQILFLDQRGTGLSSTITAGTLALQGDAIKQAEYLKNFRADNIVRDCEAVRHCLTKDYPADQRKWSAVTRALPLLIPAWLLTFLLYHSPEGLKEAFITGGLAPLVDGPDPVYQRTYEKVEERNTAYYAKFPEDVERVKNIIQYLKENRPALPSGTLTPARFQQLGIVFGLHDIVVRATNDLEVFGALTYPTLCTIDGYGGYDKTILYAVLHEALYCQGRPSLWSADRQRAGNARFQLDSEPAEIFFTGEMVMASAHASMFVSNFFLLLQIYKDMFESYTELKQVWEAADIIARVDNWPALYDEAQLARNEVPVYAATYFDDMFVHFDLATNTASRINGTKQFITNTMYHDALRSKSGDVIQQLFNLRDDSLD